ncbi:MAG: hypothetical protein ACOCWB_07420, partial [Bacteroidota bacterium]
YKITSMAIDEGIEQIMIMTAEGSGILIQKYESINPELITELMINEVLKSAGVNSTEMKRTKKKRKLVSGQKLNVEYIKVSSGVDAGFFEFASLGSDSQGIFIITMITNEEFSKQGTQIIDLLWKSLSCKL